MKLNKTMKKFFAVVLSLALVVSSMAIDLTTSKAAEGDFEITDIIWSDADGKKTFDVIFTPVSSETTGDADPYLYTIYLDQMDSEHSAINLSAGWNWKNNFQWLNPVGGFNNNYKFDGVFTTAAEWTANNKASTYLLDGEEHKVIIAAYETVADANANVNPIAVTEKVLEIPEVVEPSETESPTEPPVPADETRDIVWDENDYYGSTTNQGWNGATSTFTVDGSNATVLIHTSGYSEGDNTMWAIQAKTQKMGLVVGEAYAYTTTVVSDVDKEIYIKVSTIDGSNAELSGQKVVLVAGVPQTITMNFVSNVDACQVIYAMGTQGAEAEKSNVTINITESSLKGAVAEIETPSETTSSNEPTTPDPEGYVTITGSNEDVTGLGNWSMWINPTHTMKILVDPENPDHIKAKMTANGGNWEAWAIQYKMSKYGLTPGESYTMEIAFSADSTDFRPTIDGSSYYNGDQTETAVIVEVPCTADESGKISAVIGLGYVGLDVTVEISNVVVKDLLGNVVEVKDEPVIETPSETTTPEETTTVAPTTTAKAKVTAPKKTKVKKATKKKSSKKVKLSIKKVKGANGYRVQFSTTKKFKKVLVTKNVKKAKVTVTSKKLKNKKKLYVRVKAYKLDGKKKVLAKKWSKAKNVKIKK